MGILPWFFVADELCLSNATKVGWLYPCAHCIQSLRRCVVLWQGLAIELCLRSLLSFLAFGCLRNGRPFFRWARRNPKRFLRRGGLVCFSGGLKGEPEATYHLSGHRLANFRLRNPAGLCEQEGALQARYLKTSGARARGCLCDNPLLFWRGCIEQSTIWHFVLPFFGGEEPFRVS